MFRLQNHRLLSLLAALSMAVVFSSMSGCSDAVSPEILQFRRQLLVDKSLSGESSISDIRAKLKAEEIKAGSEVTVRVRINAGDLPPWESGKAAFIATDAMGHDGDQDHDPHDCPFCSRDIQDSLAQVRFLNDTGSVISIDARELFDVTEHQLVVIQGEARLDDSEMLVLDATRMFIRR